MRVDRLLVGAAALMLGLPAEATPAPMVWVDLCSAAHPGRRVPLPIDSEREPPKACHASCGVLPGRRTVRARRTISGWRRLR